MCNADDAVCHSDRSGSVIVLNIDPEHLIRLDLQVCPWVKLECRLKYVFEVPSYVNIGQWGSSVTVNGNDDMDQLFMTVSFLKISEPFVTFYLGLQLKLKKTSCQTLLLLWPKYHTTGRFSKLSAVPNLPCDVQPASFHCTTLAIIGWKTSWWWIVGEGIG